MQQTNAMAAPVTVSSSSSPIRSTSSTARPVRSDTIGSSTRSVAATTSSTTHIRVPTRSSRRMRSMEEAAHGNSSGLMRSEPHRTHQLREQRRGVDIHRLLPSTRQRKREPVSGSTDPTVMGNRFSSTAAGAAVRAGGSSSTSNTRANPNDYYQLPTYANNSNSTNSTERSTSTLPMSYVLPHTVDSSSTHSSRTHLRWPLFHSSKSTGATPSSSTTTANSSRRQRPQQPQQPIRSLRRSASSSFLSRSQFAKQRLGNAVVLSNSRIASSQTRTRRFHWSALSSTAASSPVPSPLAVSHSSFGHTHEASSTFFEPALSLSASAAASTTTALPLSSSSSTCYVPVAVNAAAAAALAQTILLASSTTVAATRANDAALLARAQAAKHTIETAAATSDDIKQRSCGWKQRRVRHAPRGWCVFERSTRSSQTTEIVATLTLHATLAEIQRVLHAPPTHVNSSAFHCSMATLFGDTYVFGTTVRAIECPNRPATASTATNAFAVHAVSLLQRRRFVWRPQTLAFLDYSVLDSTTKRLTRVIQTLDDDDDDDGNDEDDEDDEDDESDGRSSDLNDARSRVSLVDRPQRRLSALQQLENERHVQRGLAGIVAGYTLQEDVTGETTRLCFYATHAPPVTTATKARRPSVWHRLSMRPTQTTSATTNRPSVQLVRTVVQQLSQLDAVVRRRRLGAASVVSSNISTSTTKCVTCAARLQRFRRTSECRICYQRTCRTCTRVEAIERVLGIVDYARVCKRCIERFAEHHHDSPSNVQTVEAHVTTKWHGNDPKQQLIPDARSEADDSARPVLGESERDELSATVLDDLALYRDEDGKDDDDDDDKDDSSVASYVQRLWMRRSSASGTPPALHQQHRHSAATVTNVDRQTFRPSLRDSVCLLESANASQSSDDMDIVVLDGRVQAQP